MFDSKWNKSVLHLSGRYLSATLLLMGNLMPAACSHDIYMLRMEEQLGAYGTALRWSRFEQALDMLAPALRVGYDVRAFDYVHVTSYNPLHQQESSDRSVLTQKVEIRYFLENEGAEKSMIDLQTWMLDKEKDKWFLQTGLPNFR